MILHLIFISLLSIELLADPASQWPELAKQLKTEDDSQKNLIILELKKIKNLEKIITDSIEAEKNINEALIVAKDLKMTSTFSSVLKLSKKDLKPQYVFTLLALKEEATEKQLVSFLENTLNTQWSSFDDINKISILEVASSLRMNISPIFLSHLLSEKSDQIRIIATRLAGEALQTTHDKSYSEVLKRAFSSTPHQLRQEALYAIQDLSTRDQKMFRRELESCKKDSNLLFREICSP